MIKAPLRIERIYKDVHLTGLVRPDGKVEFDGQTYDSPSTAAGMARKTDDGSNSYPSICEDSTDACDPFKSYAMAAHRPTNRKSPASSRLFIQRNAAVLARTICVL